MAKIAANFNPLFSRFDLLSEENALDTPYTVAGSSLDPSSLEQLQIRDGYFGRILFVYIRLSTNATVADRDLQVDYLSQDGARIFRIHAPATIPASQFCDFYFAIDTFPTVNAGISQQQSLPDIVLSGSMKFQFIVNQAQFGDAYVSNIVFYVREYENVPVASAPGMVTSVTRIAPVPLVL